MHAALLAALLNTAAIDRAVRLVMRTQHVPALSIAVSRGDRSLYERGYGIGDLGHRTAASARTIYRIGSLTKPFTAAAVLQLAQAGRLLPDNPVIRYVPAFPWGAGITLRELLEQRSGIPSYTDTPALDPYAQYAPQQLIDAVAAEQPAFDPGTEFQYSNTNYALLGMAIESASGVSYAKYLQSAILAPYGLRDTRYGDAPNMAHGYARDTLNLPLKATSVSYAYAAAGMTSNVLDLTRWLRHARSPYYGMQPENMYGYAVRYATGNVDGYSAFELLEPRRRESIVILTNADRLDLFPLAQSVFALLERPAPETYAHGFGPPQNEDPRITRQVRALAARRLRANGALTLLEFLDGESGAAGELFHYRATFANGAQFILTLRRKPDGALNVTGVRRP